MRRSRPHRILVTLGDPDGIGPELVAKLLRSGQLKNSSSVEWLLVGSSSALSRYTDRFAPIDTPALGHQSPPRNSLFLLAAPTRAPKKGQLLAGYQSGWAIETATNLILSGSADALVTGPIDKSRLMAGGFAYPGHTEFLAHLCGKKTVTMMLANDIFRVTLVTTHIGLADVSRAIRPKNIETTVLNTYRGLKQFFRIAHPKIAVLGLNPHCGERGVFGREEIDVISPTIRALSRRHSRKFTVSGPYSADTFFANELKKRRSDRFDAIVCMYHDQGLIPVKLADFGRTVNLTLGLPIVRTSVDHGVGFDIVGKGLADPSSFAAAASLAQSLVRGKR